MKIYKRQFIAVTLIFAIGLIAAGTVTADEKPIWRNFMNEATLTGTLPDAVKFTHTAPIWHAHLETFQKASLVEQDNRLAFPVALDETSPIWCEQTKCL